MLILHILFWTSFLCMIHSYVIYPAILWVLASGKRPTPPDIPDEWPMVYLVMSLFNEKEVIDDKIQNLLSLDYPLDRIQIYIGSDQSVDGTNAIIEHYAAQYDHIHSYVFHTRRGKPSVVNDLVEIIQANNQDKSSVLVISDASVMINSDAIKKMVCHFSDETIRLLFPAIY